MRCYVERYGATRCDMMRASVTTEIRKGQIQLMNHVKASLSPKWKCATFTGEFDNCWEEK